MRNPGTRIIALGCVLIVAALAITGWNLIDAKRAGDAAQEALGTLKNEIAEHNEKSDPTAHNTADNGDDTEMPAVTIDGQEYIGIISIPVLELELPVMADWSYSKMKVAPCRYKGSIYNDNMIIIAHNYQQFFGTLRYLNPGNNVIFTDSENNVFHYTVKETERLRPTDVDRLAAGDWDLTLVTCTPGAQFRVAVRCTLTEVLL